MLCSVLSSFEIIALTLSVFYLSCDCQCFVSLPRGAGRLHVILAFPDHTHLMYVGFYSHWKCESGENLSAIVKMRLSRRECLSVIAQRDCLRYLSGFYVTDRINSFTHFRLPIIYYNNYQFYRIMPLLDGTLTTRRSSEIIYIANDWTVQDSEWICPSDDGTVLQANSDSDVMFCLQSYQGLRKIDIHLCINPIRRIGSIHKWSIDSR